MDAHVFTPGLVPPSSTEAPILILVRGAEVLVEDTDAGPAFPSLDDVAALAGPRMYLGQLGDTPFFAAPLLASATPTGKMRLQPGRIVAAALAPGLVAALGQAVAMVEWDTFHRYCGGCSAHTEPVPNERAKRCPRCAAVYYPRIAPAVIVLVHRGREILLARGASFPARWFSLPAGFVETGESLEEAAVREVREELGITVTDLRYDGSQPWPFGRSLMVGFLARPTNSEIKVDGSEITEAAWFSIDALPPLPPPISIARQMIDRFIADSAAKK